MKTRRRSRGASSGQALAEYGVALAVMTGVAIVMARAVRGWFGAMLDGAAAASSAAGAFF